MTCKILAVMKQRMKLSMMQSKLHATHVCVLCFWASKAGLGGIVSRLAKAPGGSSGSYAKHFNRTVGADLNDDDSLYAVDVPSFKRGHMVRSSQEIAMYPPHEAADDEINNTPNMPDTLGQSVERNELPQSYFNHHITRQAPHGTPVYPFALNTDAVGFQRTDNVLGVWLVSFGLFGKGTKQIGRGGYDVARKPGIGLPFLPAIGCHVRSWPPTVGPPHFMNLLGGNAERKPPSTSAWCSWCRHTQPPHATP